MGEVRRLASAAIVAALLGCYPTTTRPAFLPLPAASVTEIELPVPRATSALAVMLDQDSIPVSRTEAKDGWLETGWFDAATLRPTHRRPLGEGVVKVRAWIDPSRPRFSNVTVETVYRPLADPSLPERELERQVPASNPVAGRVALALSQLAKVYGGGSGVAPDSTHQPAASPTGHGPR